VGSVEVLPSGRFRVRVWVKGKKTGDIFATREEAERQRATLAVRHRAVAETMPPEPAATTVASWGAPWLQRRVEAGEVRGARRDAQVWERYVSGTELAGMVLRDVRPKHVAAWIDGMIRRRKVRGGEKLSPQTIRRAFALLRYALADAVRAEELDANPCAGARLPKPREAAWAFLTTEEVASVERGAPGVPEVSRRAFVVALRTGLRLGELVALRWGDVTLDGPLPALHVQRSNAGPTKSGRSRRVPLAFAPAVEALRAQLADAGGGSDRDALVFPSPAGRQRSEGDDFGWSPRKRLDAPRVGYRVMLGVARRVRFHDLRHSLASHLAMGTWTEAPFPLHDVARWLGHSSVAVTEKYAHLSPSHLHDRAKAPAVGHGTPGAVPRPTETPTIPVKIVAKPGQNECPGWLGWGSVASTVSGCLQQMWDEGPGDFYGPPPHGHYLNMSSRSFTRVACGYFTSGGATTAVQNFQ
jgi:integrase